MRFELVLPLPRSRRLSRKRNQGWPRRSPSSRRAESVVRPLVAAASLLALLAWAPAATAQNDALAEARAEIEDARVLVDEAVDAVEGGDREAGYELAREAYLDNYERVEIPLRLRDPNLVLDVE